MVCLCVCALVFVFCLCLCACVCSIRHEEVVVVGASVAHGLSWICVMSGRLLASYAWQAFASQNVLFCVFALRAAPLAEQ